MEDEILSYCKNEFSLNSSFHFKITDTLRDVSREVPNKPGVYLIYSWKGEMKKLVYIGMAGTMLRSGAFKEQKLYRRLNNRATGGLPRQEYFRNKIKINELDYLEFYWFVTYNDLNKLLPGYVEGKLFQMFFELSNKQNLPDWNEEF